MNKPGILCCCAAFALLAHGSAMGGTTFMDDFSSGTDGNWTHFDLLQANGLGPTVYDASSGAYSISSFASLPALPLFAATGSALTNSLLDAPTYSDGVARVTMRADNDATNLGLAVRLSPTADAGYNFFLNLLSDGVGIADVGLGTGSIAAAEMSLSPNVDYIVEASFEGTLLSMKVWESGQAEPAMPQVTLTDSLYATGAMALVVYNQTSDAGGVGGQIAGTFDNVSFVPEPASMVLLAAAALLLRRRRYAA